MAFVASNVVPARFPDKLAFEFFGRTIVTVQQGAAAKAWNTHSVSCLWHGFWTGCKKRYLCGSMVGLSPRMPPTHPPTMDTTRQKDEKFGECYFRVAQKVTFAESVTRKHEWLSKKHLHTMYGD